MWINAGDIILIGLRDYQDTKADVILKYNSDEARNLKAYGELPENGEIALVIASLCGLRDCKNIIFSRCPSFVRSFVCEQGYWKRFPAIFMKPCEIIKA